MAKTGYCSICKRPDLKKINKGIQSGLSYNSIRELVDDPPAKATFFKHKEHVTAPLLTDAEEARRYPVIKPQSNKEVLEAIRDIGLRNAMENPDSIKPSHALRAAQILSDKEQKTDSVKVVLARLLTSPINPIQIESAEIVEAEYSIEPYTEFEPSER